VLVRLGLVGTSRGMPVYAGLEREPGGAVLANVADQPGGPDPEGDVPATVTDDGTEGLGLPVSKLRGLAPRVRAALKVHRVTTCGQLLRAAGGARDRDRLAREAGIDPDALRAGSVCLNRLSGLIGGASAGFRPPRSAAAG
jgi:hypothetical protein